MSRSLYIKILQPVVGFRKNKIYTDQDIADAGLDTYYMDVPEGKYFKKLKVRSNYASMADIVAFTEQKYGLAKLENYSMSHSYRNDVAIFKDDKKYVVTCAEVDALKKDHVDEYLYCKTYRDFSVDVYLYDVLTKLVDDAYVQINDKLIQKALKLAAENLEEGELESLENFFEYNQGSEGKLIASMLIAQKIAEKVGGIAVMEYE